MFLFVSERYSSLGQIVRRYFNSHPVAKKDVDKVHAHLPRNIAEKYVTVLKLDLEHRVRKGLYNLSILFYCYLF